MKKSELLLYVAILGILCFTLGAGFAYNYQKDVAEKAEKIGYAKGIAWQVDHKDCVKEVYVIETDSMLTVKFIYKK